MGSWLAVPGYFGLAETRLEPSDAVAGSAPGTYIMRTIRVHAVEVDDAGERRELTACGRLIPGQPHQLRWDEVQMDNRCVDCSRALGAPRGGP